MKIEMEDIKVLADTADLMNTINGGMSLAHIQKLSMADHKLVSVRVPGVNNKSLKVEVKKGVLFVFLMVPIDDGVRIPMLVANMDIPDDVITEEVRANYQGRSVNIVMPLAN